VLGSGYDLDRGTLHALMERLVRTRGVVVEDLHGVIEALDRFEVRGDFLDQLIVARAERVGAVPVITFDGRFAREDSVERL
jgi:predicted nucleic-acid-binding protein